MNNSRLQRDADKAKDLMESTINELIAEIEELESDKDKMQNEIDELKKKFQI